METGLVYKYNQEKHARLENRHGIGEAVNGGMYWGVVMGVLGGGGGEGVVMRGDCTIKLLSGCTLCKADVIVLDFLLIYILLHLYTDRLIN